MHSLVVLVVLPDLPGRPPETTQPVSPARGGSTTLIDFSGGNHEQEDREAQAAIPS
jgi:hypothetical protein